MLEPVHISRLRKMAQSPAHFAADAQAETYAMERGTAVHQLVFGTGGVHVWPEGKQRRGKDYDAFCADHPGDVVLTHAEGSKALAMAASVRLHRLAMSVLEGEREQLRTWRIGDRECAGTPDVVGARFVTELKTSQSSAPGRFGWQAVKMGYHAQLAWYRDGLGAAGQDLGACIVAVEATAPFPVTVFRLRPEALVQGRRMYRLWLERLLVCEASDEWPAYAQDFVDLDVPDDAELDFTAGEVAEAAAPF